MGVLVASLAALAAETIGPRHSLSFIPFLGVFVFSPGSMIAVACCGFLSTSVIDYAVRIGANGVVYSLIYLGYFLVPERFNVNRITYYAALIGLWVIALVFM